MKKALTYLFLLAVCIGCTKDPTPLEAIPTVPEEEPTPEPTEPEDSSSYATLTFSVDRSIQYLGSDVTQDIYIGNILHLKDSTDNVYWEPLNYGPLDLRMYVFSSALVAVEVDTIKPSYQAMVTYARKHEGNQQSVSGSSQSISFSDYAEIQRYLPKNADVEAFLALANEGDSTIVRKAHSSLLRAETVAFTIFVDYVDVMNKFKEYLQQSMAANKSPYLITEVAYGKQYIIMAESDSTRAQINTAVEKLLANEALETTDNAVLEATKLLVYYRGAAKESFVEKAVGLDAIRVCLQNFQREYERADQQFDYPLHYMAIHLNSGEILKYRHSFSLLKKE